MGQIFAPNDYMPLDNFSSPRRMMRTRRNSLATAGMVFRTNTDSRLYMLANHTSHETPRVHLKTFRLFELDRQLLWQRYGSVEDLVTGLTKSNELASLGTIYAALELPKTEADQIKIPRPKFRLVTPSEVKLDDLVDGKKVTQVYSELGVWFAEIE